MRKRELSGVFSFFLLFISTKKHKQGGKLITVLVCGLINGSCSMTERIN